MDNLEKENRKLKFIIILFSVLLLAFGFFYFYEKVLVGNGETSNNSMNNDANVEDNKQNDVIYFNSSEENKEYQVNVNGIVVPIKYQYIQEGQKVNLTINDKVTESIVGPYKLQVLKDLIVVSYKIEVLVPNETLLVIYDAYGNEKLKVDNSYISNLHYVDPEFTISNNKILFKGNSLVQGGVETDNYYIVLCEQWGETNLLKDNLDKIDKSISIEYEYEIEYNGNHSFSNPKLINSIKTINDYINDNPNYCVKFK